MIQLDNDWDTILKDEFNSPYYHQLHDFLKVEYEKRVIYPNMYDIFNALKLTSFENTKVLILGQDPYHEPGQAHGLAFSVQDGTMLPPSLRNMYKEIESDIGIKMSKSGDLTSWAKQGVLLLNTVLTVREGMANSHQGKGWEQFTDAIVSKLNERKDPVIFVLWGGNARQKKALITNPWHIVLEAAHPSPLSAYRGFFGCHHFSEINQNLERMGKTPIDWKI